MCGACQKAEKDECRAQTGKRMTTACTYCADLKKPCGSPSPAWAKAILQAFQSRGESLLKKYLCINLLM